MNQTPSSQQTVLIVSDVASQADLVKSLLQEHVEKVLVATEGDAASEAFRQERPSVLVFAYTALQSATKFYLALFRRATELGIPVHPHRTIALCDRKDVKEAFDLCTNGQINDYVQFWPTTYDTPRLVFAVRRAIREGIDQAASAMSSSALIAQGKHLAQLESVLSQYTSTGSAHLATASTTLARTKADIETALTGLSAKILSGTSVQLRPGIATEDFSRELSGYSAESILPKLRDTSRSLEPISEWAGQLEKVVKPQIHSSRAQLQQALQVGRTLLIVDDDQFQRQMVGRVVESAGYRAIYAGNGSEALAMIRNAPPDLVLMDVLMPNMNGLEVVQRLKADPAMSKIPIVMVTGKSARNVVLESVKLGVADFVVKPIERANLLDKIARLLTSPAMTSA